MLRECFEVSSPGTQRPITESQHQSVPIVGLPGIHTPGHLHEPSPGTQRDQAPARDGWRKKPESRSFDCGPGPRACIVLPTIRSTHKHRHAMCLHVLRHQHEPRIPCSNFASNTYLFGLSLFCLLRVDLRRGAPHGATRSKLMSKARSSVELNTTPASEAAGASSNVRFSPSSWSRANLG